jgi:sulfur carrier protein
MVLTDPYPDGIIDRFMRVTVNGDVKELTDGTTVTILLEQLKLTPRQVAVELNRRLLRSEKYDGPLKDGDAVEIVTFVGGG